MRVRRKRRKRKSGCGTFFSLVIITGLLVYGIVHFNVRFDAVPVFNNIYSDSADEKIAAFAASNNLQLDAWPDELIALLEKNPDAEKFVLDYPLKKDLEYSINLDEYENADDVPLLFQWDERWGYSQYSGEMMGLSGCGPTCLSMVSIYLLNDSKYSPKYIAEFAENNGYSVAGSGSAWTLISEGGKELGMDVVEIPLDESRIKKNLDVGNPIICVLGPGDFTDTGHFIVLTEYRDGKIKVNDPNSKIRSEKLWSFDDLEGQIRNLWVLRK